MPYEPLNTHYDTATKAKVQGTREFLFAHDIPHDVRDIFKQLGVRSDRTGYKMLEEGASSRTHYNTDVIETRGRRGKLTADQILEADSILQDRGLQLEGNRYTWDQLATEVGAEVSGRTMRSHNAYYSRL